MADSYTYLSTLTKRPTFAEEKESKLERATPGKRPHKLTFPITSEILGGWQDLPHYLKRFGKDPSKETLTDLLQAISESGGETLKTVFGEHPLESITGVGPTSQAVSFAGKSNIWKAVQDALKQERNIYYGYHATYRPLKMLQEGVYSPLGFHEAHKGRALFVGADPFMAITQRTGFPYVYPKDFLTSYRGLNVESQPGVVRMVLAPHRTFSIEEPIAKQYFSKLPLGQSAKLEFISDAYRKLGEMTKLLKTDIDWFKSGQAVEYLVRDPSIVKAMSWSKYSLPAKGEQIPAKSWGEMAERIREIGGGKISEAQLEDLTESLRRLGRIERGVEEYGLPVAKEWMEGSVKQRRFGHPLHKPKSMAQIVEDVIQSQQGEFYKPSWGKKAEATPLPKEPSKGKWWIDWKSGPEQDVTVIVEPPQTKNLPSFDVNLGSSAEWTGDVKQKTKIIDGYIQDYAHQWNPEFDYYAQQYLKGKIDNSTLANNFYNISEAIKTGKYVAPKPTEYINPAVEQILAWEPPPNIGQYHVEDVSKAMKHFSTQEIMDIQSQAMSDTHFEQLLMTEYNKFLESWGKKPILPFKGESPVDILKKKYPPISKAYPNAKDQEILMSVFGNKLGHATIGEMNKALELAQKFESYQMTGPLSLFAIKEIKKSLFGGIPKKGGSPIPLTPDQHTFLKAVFGEDLESTATPTLQKALAFGENFGYKPLDSVITFIHNQLGMKKIPK